MTVSDRSRTDPGSHTHVRSNAGYTFVKSMSNYLIILHLSLPQTTKEFVLNETRASQSSVRV